MTSQPHPEDNSGKSNIQAPKQPAQNTNRTAGAGNIARAQHGGDQVLFRLFVEGEKANDGQITVATVVPIKKGELLLAVCRIVRRIQIDGDSAGTPMQPFSVALDDAIGQGLAQAKQFLAIRGIFKT